MKLIDRELYLHIGFCTLLTVALSVRHTFFMVYVLLLFLAVGLVYSLWVIAKKPDKRRVQAIKVGIWTLGLVVIFTTGFYTDYTTTKYANQVSTAVEKHMEIHGKCPRSLDEIGISPSWFKAHLGLGGYSCESGRPFLYYADPLIMFDMVNYDFEKRAWFVD